MERALCADLYGNGRPKIDVGDWRLTVLQNKHGRAGTGNSLEMLVTLENSRAGAPRGRGNVLRQRPPGFMAIDLQPNGLERRGSLRWTKAWGYPADAWRIEVPSWPTDARDVPLPPRLSVCWIEDETPNVHRRLTHQDPATKFEDAFQDRRVKVDDMTVTVESIAVEKWRFAEDGGEDSECLVVRLGHEPHDKPIWVQLRGLESHGEMHLFYPKAGKVTAVFRHVTRDAAQNQGFTLNLISLDAFKKEATHRVRSEQLKLPSPSPYDIGPQRIQLEKPGG
jgi:hypothetical protein